MLIFIIFFFFGFFQYFCLKKLRKNCQNDKEIFDKQYKFIIQILTILVKEPQNKPKLIQLFQKTQEYGNPPQRIALASQFIQLINRSICYLFSHWHRQKWSFQIRRRYSDFYALRQAMVQYFLDLYIPPISSKKATAFFYLFQGNTQQKFVQQRKRFLDYFCVKVSQRPYLFYSQMFQFFVRGQPDFQRGLKFLPLPNLKAQLHVYKQNFTVFIQNTNSAQLLLKNETDYDYLKKAEFKFQNIREEFRAVADAKKNYADQFNYCFQTVFPDYQQKFLLVHAQKNRDKLILKDEETVVKIKEYRELAAHNPLEDYVEMISCELRQTRALIQAVQTRKKAEDKKVKMEIKRKDLKAQLQKLQAGKSTLKSFFASGTKQVQIQSLKAQIPQLQEQSQCLNQMINLMNGACNNQIKEYKQKRGKQYVNVLRDVAKKQIKELTVYGNVLRIPLKAIG